MYVCMYVCMYVGMHVVMYVCMTEPGGNVHVGSHFPRLDGRRTTEDRRRVTEHREGRTEHGGRRTGDGGRRTDDWATEGETTMTVTTVTAATNHDIDDREDLLLVSCLGVLFRRLRRAACS